MVNPRKLFVTEPFKKGELKIAPKGVLSAVSAIHDSKASPYTADCEVKQGDALMKFRVQPPKTTADPDPSKWKDAVFEAFWWVQATDDEAKANMEIQTEEVKNVTVRVWTNTCRVTPTTELQYYKPKAESNVDTHTAAKEKIAHAKAAAKAKRERDASASSTGAPKKRANPDID